MGFIDRHMVTPCQIINRIEADEPDVHGNPVYVDAEPVRTRCFVTPRAGNESMDGRAVEEGWTLFLPAAMAGRVGAFSYLDVEGIGRVEVEGEPAVHASLYSHRVHHVEVTTRRSTA